MLSLPLSEVPESAQAPLRAILRSWDRPHDSDPNQERDPDHWYPEVSPDSTVVFARALSGLDRDDPDYSSSDPPKKRERIKEAEQALRDLLAERESK